jgi:hypothetical protein
MKKRLITVYGEALNFKCSADYTTCTFDGIRVLLVCERQGAGFQRRLAIKMGVPIATCGGESGSVRPASGRKEFYFATDYRNRAWTRVLRNEVFIIDGVPFWGETEPQRYEPHAVQTDRNESEAVNESAAQQQKKEDDIPC